MTRAQRLRWLRQSAPRPPASGYMVMGFTEFEVAEIERHFRTKMNRYDALPRKQRDRIKNSIDGAIVIGGL